jgi:hypothetical protein
MPVEIGNATEQYRMESDSLATFLDHFYEMCPNGFVTCSEINGKYANWVSENGEISLDARAFAGRLREQGCLEARSSDRHRTRGWKGIKPKADQISNNADARTCSDAAIH